VQHAAQAVEIRARQASALHLALALFDARGGDGSERQRAQGSFHDVAPQPGALAVRARLRTALAQPPVTELAQGHARVGGQRLQPEALPLGAPL